MIWLAGLIVALAEVDRLSRAWRDEKDAQRAADIKTAQATARAAQAAAKARQS